MRKTIVIYHRADFDGLFCREIARKFLEAERDAIRPDGICDRPTIEYIGWDYGDAVPTPDVVSAEDQLYMLDISVEGLMGHPNLIWIDHHKSAIEKWGGTGLHDRPAGYRIDGVAACRLAWVWFETLSLQHDAGGVVRQDILPTKQEFIDRTVSEPLAVRLAGEYDIWDKRDPDADLFQHGLRSQPLGELDWRDLLSFDQSKAIRLLEQGKIIQYVQTEQNASIIKAYGFDVEFEGLKFLACNHARFNSHLFTAGLKPEHDALLGFNWSGKEWRVSLYHAPGKEHHDLSLIATKHGGGGHRGACGFRMSKLPFLP